MKLDDLEAGVEYAVRRGAHGSFGRLRMLGIETVEVRAFSAGAMRSHPKPQRLARMAIVGDPEKCKYSPSYQIPKPQVEGELLVPARDVAVLWAEHAEAEEARRRYREEREAEAAAVRARTEGFEARLTALLGEHFDVVQGPEGYRAASHVQLPFEALEKLLDFAEEAGTGND